MHRMFDRLPDRARANEMNSRQRRHEVRLRGLVRHGGVSRARAGHSRVPMEACGKEVPAPGILPSAANEPRTCVEKASTAWK